MQVFMCKGFSGEILRVEIDPESSPEKQMANFVYKLYGENAINDSFMLFNVTRDFEYPLRSAFKENTAENDLLLLVNSHIFPGC